MGEAPMEFQKECRVDTQRPVMTVTVTHLPTGIYRKAEASDLTESNVRAQLMDEVFEAWCESL